MPADESRVYPSSLAEALEGVSEGLQQVYSRSTVDYTAGYRTVRVLVQYDTTVPYESRFESTP